MKRSTFSTIRHSLTVGCLLATVSALLAVEPPQIERIFGPEIKTGPYKHPARFTQLQNGDFYLVYYGGEGEYANDTAVFGSRQMAGTTNWTAPEVIAKDPFRSLGNGVVWQAPDGLVWLFYVVRFGDTWSSSRVQAKVSKDNAQTWSDAFPLHLEAGMMVCNQPIVLQNGDYLLPLYSEKGEDKEMTGAESTSLFLRYDPTGKKWSETARIRSATGNIQPAAVQLSDDHLVAYCRRGGGYEPTTNGYLIRAESHDGGQTWSKGKDSQFPNPNAAIDFIKLKSGNLLLVYNDSMNERTPLSAALSKDGDKTYPHRRQLATGPYDYAYPLALQAQDGKIHVLFTSHERTVVNRIIFDEEWLKAARPVQAKPGR